MPYEMAEDWYDGAIEEGAEQNALSTCGDRTAKGKAEIPIEDLESGDQQFRARQTETPDIGEKPRQGLRDRKEDSHRP